MGNMTCKHCRATAPDGHILCVSCANQLRNTLTQIPHTLEHARHQASGLAVNKPAGGSGTSNNTKPVHAPDPINLHTHTLTTKLIHQTRHWARYLAQHQKTKPGTVQATHYLITHIREFARLPQAHHAKEQLEHQHQLLTHALERPQDIILLGPCLHPRCKGTMATTNGSPTAHCDQCTTTHRTHAVQDHRTHEATHILVPLSVAINSLNAMGHHLKIKTARDWVRRGELYTEGTLEDGTRLYSPAQVYRVAKDMKQRRIIKPQNDTRPYHA